MPHISFSFCTGHDYYVMKALWQVQTLSVLEKLYQ